ncbi:hypothetical protein DPMN_067605 [Dreissena polymorpha]|uniref:Uncharacterized protein n=1 Tax=Dreissena polymorpha TaxID=45954 RepID=A0A9D3YVK5_DREPO|nr:hypothetical protein DPMN_067605 [Dreissena polymorpha]
MDLCDIRREMMDEKYTSLDIRANYQEANMEEGRKRPRRNGLRNNVPSLTKRRHQAAVRRLTAPS